MSDGSYVLKGSPQPFDFSSGADIKNLPAGTVLQRANYHPDPSKSSDEVSREHKRLGNSETVRIIETNSGLDAKPHIGLLSRGEGTRTGNNVRAVRVEGLGKGFDAAEQSKSDLVYYSTYEAAKQLNLPYPSRVYTVNNGKDHGVFLKFNTISDAEAFRNAMSNGTLSEITTQLLEEVQDQLKDLEAALRVDMKSITEASERIVSFPIGQDQKGYQMFRVLPEEMQEAKTLNKSNMPPEEVLALKICERAAIENVEMGWSNRFNLSTKTKEWGVAYQFATQEDAQKFAKAVREPLTVKAAMEAVRDDMVKDCLAAQERPDNQIDEAGREALGKLVEKLKGAGKGGLVH